MARPLSKTAHQAILTAFVTLIERRSIDDITTEDIAQEAGASKSTLYKHWADKEELLIEAIGELVMALPVANSGNLQADAAHVLGNMFVEDKSKALGRIWPKLFAYSASHPEFCPTLNQGLVQRAPKHTLVAILREAIATGEFPADLDVELALDLLAGPLLNRRLLCGSVPKKFPAEIVALIWPLLRRPQTRIMRVKEEREPKLSKREKSGTGRGRARKG